MYLMALISGGIDSPVASALMASQGYDLLFLHMDNRPFSDDNVPAKVRRLARKIKEWSGVNARLIIAPHGEVAQVEIANHCNPHYHCLLCRRVMLLTAQRLCMDMGARAIVTGESLGQVASQTLNNILAESRGINTPILRPLIAWDKDEIVKKAKDIGTYDISIERGLCCLLAPQHPKTSATVEGLMREEACLDLDGIVEKLVSEVRVEDV